MILVFLCLNGSLDFGDVFVNPAYAQSDREYISFCPLKLLVGMYFHYFKTSDVADFIYFLEFGYN